MRLGPTVRKKRKTKGGKREEARDSSGERYIDRNAILE